MFFYPASDIDAESIFLTVSHVLLFPLQRLSHYVTIALVRKDDFLNHD